MHVNNILEIGCSSTVGNEEFSSCNFEVELGKPAGDTPVNPLLIDDADDLVRHNVVMF